MPRRLFARGETSFVRCPECGLAFRERFPNEQELDAIYKAAYEGERIATGATNQESGTFAVSRYARFILSRLCAPGQQLLDFGAGSGELVEALRAEGINADGLEYAHDARRHCAITRGFELAEDFTGEMRERYDAVTAIEVIEHVTDLPRVLRSIRHVLKPGGGVLITTPNLNGWRARIQKGSWSEACKPFHLFLFNPRSIDHHLLANGFTNIRHVRFRPVMKPGASKWLVARATQLAGMQSSLCVLAQKG